MAKPSDFRRVRQRIRYGAESGDVGECFALSIPATPNEPMLRYNSQRPYQSPAEPADDDQSPDDDLVARICAAIGQTDEMKFLRKLMAQQSQGMASGEVARDDPAPQAMMEAKREHYQRVRHCGSSPTAEQYAKREQAHADVVTSCDALNESRRAVSERAAAYALSHQCGYDNALLAIGSKRPHIGLPTASPV